MIISQHSTPQIDFIPCKKLQILLSDLIVIESKQMLFLSGANTIWKASYIISETGTHLVYCDLLSTKGTNAHLRFSLENTSAPPKHYSYTDTIKDKIITKTVKTQRQANKLNNIVRLLKAQIYISIYSLLEEQKKIFGTEYNTYKNEYDDLYSCVSD